MDDMGEKRDEVNTLLDTYLKGKDFLWKDFWKKKEMQRKRYLLDLPTTKTTGAVEHLDWIFSTVP